MSTTKNAKKTNPNKEARALGGIIIPGIERCAFNAVQAHARLQAKGRGRAPGKPFVPKVVRNLVPGACMKDRQSGEIVKVLATGEAIQFAGPKSKGQVLNSYLSRMFEVISIPGQKLATA